MDPTAVSLDASAAQFISESSEIPPDITFKFREADNDLSEVAAHKMILAMVSEVFRNMFFVLDTTDRSADAIIIEDSNKQTFQMMIDAVYNVKLMKESLKGKTVDEIFTVLYLVTKYKISSLELAVKEHLSSFPFTEDSVIEAANDALEYSATFEEAVQIILLAAAKFLKSKFSDPESFIEFVAKNGDEIATVQKLTVLRKDLPPSPTTLCYGCLRVETECLNGEAVKESDMKVGIKVIRSPTINRTFRADESQGVGVVVREEASNKRHWVILWENNQENGDWSGWRYLFLFKCR